MNVSARIDRTGPWPAHLTLGAGIGACAAFIGLDPRFITGGGGTWIRPEGDFNGYLVAWHYFIADAWRFPLFGVPAMGYPEGSNVVFSDVLPLTALLSKAVHSTLGFTVMPFGWWTLLTYALQGLMAARLVAACGAGSKWASIGAATLAVCCMPFTWRLGHVALSSHFLILWALALYFESARRQRLRTIEWAALLLIAVMVNPYLFAIVTVLNGATVLEMWRQKHLGSSDVRAVGIALVLVLVLAIVEGYGVLAAHPGSLAADGLGVYSWNLVTLLVPPESWWGFPSGIVRDATGGQYEGDAYIGLGALLMLATGLAVTRGALLAHARRHAVLVAVLLLLAVAAASNSVYAGGTLLLTYELPAPVERAASALRGTGRFIWPLAYTLIVVPVALVFRRVHPALAVASIVVAMALQVKEAAATFQTVRLTTSQPLADLIDTPRVTRWMEAHDRVWQYPSWPCGGLAGSGRVWLGTEANRELQVQLLGARLNKPTNSVISSRSFKDCARELSWGQHPRFENGVLYLLGPESVAASPPLAALATGDRCVNVTWALACSASASRLREF